MKMTMHTYNEILRTIGSNPPEQGGILGIKTGVVDYFIFDADARATRAEYHPNTSYLNSTILAWSKENVDFCGIIHSHSNVDALLSMQDVAFARAILKENFNLLKYIYFPLVILPRSFEIMKIVPFVITNDSICEESILIT